jgi:hypothetical protein
MCCISQSNVSSGIQPGVSVPPGLGEDILWGTRKHLISIKTQKPLEPWTSSDPSTHEDSSPNSCAAKPEISSIVSSKGHKHINNW